MFRRVIASLLLFFSSSHAWANCSGGSCGTRGGGDFLEWTFFDVAKAVVPVLLNTPSPNLKVQVLKMQKSLDCLHVVVSEDPFLDLDGRSVTAINTPSLCQIILSRPGWADLKTNEARVRLVVHELLSLALIEDFQYQKSQVLSLEYFKLVEGLVKGPPNKFLLFTSSGLFSVPTDVSRVRVTIVGAGGGGGGGHLDRGLGGGGGGGGAVRTRDVIVKGMNEVIVTVGQGGAGAQAGGFNGSRGEGSSFGNFLFAEGGGGGYAGYYNTSMGYGGTGSGSGGGGGGSGVRGVCSGAGGKSGAPGENGFVTRNGGAGGAGGGWDSLADFVKLISYEAGQGGACLGPATTYNGGGGGGGLFIGETQVVAENGRASQDLYTGSGGGGGEGYGAGGGGGTGAQGAGGNGAPGVVYIEFFSSL